MKRELNNINTKEDDQRKGSDKMGEIHVNKRLVNQIGLMVPGVMWPFYSMEIVLVFFMIGVGMTVADDMGSLRYLVDIVNWTLVITLGVNTIMWLLRGIVAYSNHVRLITSWRQTRKLYGSLRGPSQKVWKFWKWFDNMTDDMIWAIRHCRVITYQDGRTLCIVPDKLGLMSQHEADRLNFDGQVMDQLVNQLQEAHTGWCPIANAHYEYCWFYPLV